MDLSKYNEEIIYLDNASTVFPKPTEILDRMVDLYRRFGVNPGRAGYDLCLVGGELVHTTRTELARFFGGDRPERLCFAYNASDALNILIQGIVEPGDHVIASTGEHNSVIRPVNHLKRDAGVQADFVPYEADGRLDPARIAAAFRDNTKLVAISHGSNVVGTIQPVAEIGRLCRERGILFVIDSAQTAGVVPIDVEAMNIDAVAFTGHKSLLGPTGIGGVYVREGAEVRATRFGGTGIASADPYHLDEYPYRLEVGTGNVLGIVALHLAQAYLAEKGLSSIYQHEMRLFERLQSGLLEIDGVTLHGPTSLEHRLPVISLTVDGIDPADVGTMLDERHKIACRPGLHCAPLIHDQIGTSPRGTVRLSVGPMNVDSDIDTAIQAMREIGAEATK